MYNKYLLILMLVFLHLLTPSPSFGQVPQGEVLGNVTDPNGAPIPGAKVDLINEETGIKRSTITNDGGGYGFTYLTSGMYQVAVERLGFAPALIKNVPVQVEEKKRVDVQLKVGDVNATLDIYEGTASLLETDSSSVSSMISKREAQSLPLNGREFSQLALLQPGVVSEGTTGGAIVTTFATAVRIGGTSSSKNNYTQDGVDNNFNFFDGPAMNPSIDAIQEFRIERYLAPAEYGRGGAQLHLATPGGTNEFHGALWEYHRNRVFSAGNFLTHQRDNLLRNQFGGKIGGPIIKNSLFFFFNYEGQRERNSVTQQGTVLTAKMRAGDFSELSGAVIDPLTGLQFPGNQIPSSRINSLSKDLIDSLLPLPNQPGIAGNLIRTTRTSGDWDQYTTRIDYSASDKDSIFFRGSIQGRTGVGAPLGAAWINATEDFKFYNSGGGWIRAWSPTVTSETRFGIHREEIFVDTVEPPRRPSRLPAGFGPGAVDHLPVVSVSAFDTFGQAGNPLGFDFNSLEFSQNVTFAKSNHLIKTGFTGRKLDVNTPIAYTNTTWPFLTFTGTYSGNAAADLILGLPFVGFGILGHIPREQNYSDYSAYVQDDWKITPNLTLNIGLRYDLRTQPTEKRNVWGNFSPELRKIVLAGDTINEQLATPFSLSAYRTFLIPASETQLPRRTLAYGDHNNFAPRFGFAWRPFSDNKTVVRGGYGVYYILPNGNQLANNQYSIPFGGNLVTINTTPSPTFTIEDPFSSGIAAPPPPSAFYRFPRNRDGYLQQGFIGVQRELPWQIMAELNFETQKSSNLERGWNINQAVPGTGSIQSRQPFPEFSSINGVFQDGYSKYNAMEILVRKNSQHYTFQGSYTWAKNIASGPVIDPYNEDLFDGPSDYIPHQLKFHFIVDLPFGAGRSWLNEGGVANQVLGGWIVTGIINPYIGGSPLTIGWFGDPANVGISVVRPDRICSGELQNRTRQKWFDTSCFVAPAPGTFGNSGTGILFGPSSWSADFGAYKDFSLSENIKVQFRTEIFNLFNHPNEGIPNTNANGFAFGEILNKRHNPRVVQFALRLTF